MIWRNLLQKPLLPIAIFLLTFATACGPSADSVSGGVILPAIDPRDAAPCYDPGVEGTYSAALRVNRVALADCRRKQANLVALYNEARSQLGPQ